MKKIELSEHFTYGKILRYSLPAIGNMLAISSFQMVDGYFVSNLLGVVPFAAVNLILPVFISIYAVGFMFGTGSSAVISRYLGGGEEEQGRKIFSMSIAVMVLIGVAAGTLGALLMPRIAPLVGAEGETLAYCTEYGRLLFAFLPAFLINAAFQALWITAGKAWVGTVISVCNGCCNIVLDWLFMARMKMGIRGAALATSLAAMLGAAFVLFYFLRPNRSSLRFARFGKRQLKELKQICFNGASEMVDSIAANLTVLLVNYQLLRYIGEIGVAAMEVFTLIMALFMAVFFGISNTTVAVVGYKYGRQDREELRSLLKNNIVLMIGIGTLMCLLCEAAAKPVAQLYMGYDAEGFSLAVHVLRISAFSCLLYGFDVFTASYYTGLGDGLTSIILAAMTSLILPVALIWILPMAFGAEAIWYTMPAVSLLSAMICVFFLHRKRLSAFL